MKVRLLIICWLLGMFPFIGLADAGDDWLLAAEAAGKMVHELNRLQTIAQDNHHRLNGGGESDLAQQYLVLSIHAGSMASALRHLVFKPLVDGVKIKIIGANFERLEQYNFSQLELACKVAGDPATDGQQPPPAAAIARVHLAKDLLKAALVTDIHLTPRRHWLCDARSMEIDEHAGGHPGLGQSRVKAERKALSSCMVMHDACRIDACRMVW